VNFSSGRVFRSGPWRGILCASWGVIASGLFLSTSVLASPTQNQHFLEAAPEISEIQGKKEFFVQYDLGTKPWREFEVFLVAREVEDPNRKGWYDFQFVGRAAVVESSVSSAHLVMYKPFKTTEMQKGDKLLRTGDPLTLDEMDMLRNEVMGILHMDKELEDLFSGLISFKFGYYTGRFETTSTASDGSVGDTNAYKQATSYKMMTFGLRWWFFFNPATGINFDFSTGTIPTKGFKREDEESTQTYVNPGLMYRGRLLVFPTIYSLTYFMNSFKTSNPDDFLISSTYSGINAAVTLYWPYRTNLLRLGPVTIAFNNIEAGLGISPGVSVSDEKFKRGASVDASLMSLNGAIEFNMPIAGVKFTNDLFVVFEAGMQKYSMTFAGPTEGKLPNGLPLPQGGSNTEKQTWYGVRIKYNMRDIIGELLYGL
jgi:hypothetical protein